MASKFAEYKPSGLLPVWCNVGGLLQILQEILLDCDQSNVLLALIIRPPGTIVREGLMFHCCFLILFFHREISEVRVLGGYFFAAPYISNTNLRYTL